MTSPSGAILAKGTEDACGGVRDVISTLAVEVGERCIVKGWECCTWTDGVALNEGFGRARTWKRRFDSRKLACNSMTVTV